MKRTAFILSAVLLFGAFAQQDFASITGTWTGTTDASWATPGNWSSNPAVPGTGDTAVFNGAGNGNTTITVGSIVLSSLKFDTSSAAAYTFDPTVGSGTITFDNSGTAGNIVMNSTVTTNQTINSNIVLGVDTSSQTYLFNNSSTTGTLTIAGSISGGGLAGNKTLLLTGPGSGVMSGGVSNGSATSLAVTINSGTWSMTGNNTYTGSTIVNGGLLISGSTATAGLVLNGGTFQLAANNALSALTSLSLPNGIAQNSTVTRFDTGGFNQTLLNITIFNNTISPSSQGYITTESGTITLTGSVSTNGFGQGFINGNLNAAATSGTMVLWFQSFSSEPNTGLFIGANISGNNAVQIAGNGGFVTFSGSNTYTGSTVLVGQHVLNIQNTNALKGTAGVVVVSNSGLQLTGTDAAGINISVPLFINGSGLGKQGSSPQSGALINESGSNTWSGLITMTGAATIASDSGLLTLSGGISGSNGLTIGGTANGVINSLISGASITLTKFGSGTWTLSGSVPNTYTGNTIVNGGRLTVDYSNFTGATAASLTGPGGNNSLVLSGGVFDMEGNSSAGTATGGTFTNSMTLTGSTSSTLILNANGGGGTTLKTNNISRNGNSTLVFVLSSGATYNTNNPTTTNGILPYVIVQTASGTGFAGKSGNNLILYTDTTSATTLANNSNTSTVNYTTLNTTYTSGVLSWSNGITARSANSLIIDTTNNGGVIDMGASTNVLTLTSGGILFRGANNETVQNGQITIASNGELIVQQLGTGTLTLNTPLTNGSGSLTKAGNGTLVLGGINTYTGVTVINGGLLQLSGSIASTSVIMNSGTLRLGSGGQLNNAANVTLAYGADVTSLLDLNGSNQTIVNLVIGSNLSDSLSQGGVVTGSGTLTLTGGITYNANIANGLKGANISGNLNLSSGTTHNFNIAPSGAKGGTGFVSNVVSGTSSADLTIGANITGGLTGTLNITGNGVTVLSGSNTYQGLTTLTSNAFLNIQSSHALDATAGVIEVNNSTIEFQSATGITIAAPMTLSGTGASAVNGLNTFVQSGALMNISGNNIYSGTITLLNSSTISSLSGLLTLSSSSVVKGANNNLTVGGSSNGIISGSVNTGASQLIKIGTGTWTLNGTNTYTGQTVVNGGVLVVNGDNSATGGAQVNGGAFLMGTGTIGGTLSVAGGSTQQTRGTVSLVDGVIDTMTAGALALSSTNAGAAPASLLFEIGNNATDTLVIAGTMTINNGGAIITLSQLPSTTLAPGAYPLITFGSGVFSGSFTLANPTIGNNTFTLVSSGTALDLVLRLTNHSTLAITPTTAPLALNVLAGKSTNGTTTVTLTNTGTDGPADYVTQGNGAVSVTPVTSAGNGGSGATLNPGDTQTLTITASGTAPGISGSNQTIGTVSATNLNNPGAGDATPITVTANVYDPAAITPSADHFSITNTGTGSNGANSLIAAAQIQQNVLNSGSTQNTGAWTMNTSNTPFTTGSTVSVATFNPNAKIGGVGLLNGTYAAVTGLRVGNVMADGSPLGGATTGDVYTNFSYTLSGTVTGNKSSDVSDAYAADILTGATYAGYNLGSSVPGTTHTATGHGGATTTVASIAYGTSSTGASMQMSFEGTPQPGDDITRASDILVMQPNSISIISQGVDNRYLTDMFVLQLSYDASDLGLAYIVQNTPDNIWVDTVVLNSNGTLVDDGGTNAKHESFSAYLLNDAPGGVPKLGDYGYFDGVAWAVIDHTATGDNNAEFAVVATAVPEPGTYALLLGGFGVLAAFKSRRRLLS